MIDTNRLVERFLALAAIDAPSREERVMADRLAGDLRDLGFQVEEDDAGTRIGGNAGNLLAFLPGTGDRAQEPPRLFMAHMDTVEPARGKQPFLREDGVLAASGDTILGGDDLAGVCAILEAVRSLREDGTSHPPLEVILTVAEEKQLLGAKALDMERIRSREAYVLDTGGAPGNVTVRAPGHRGLRVEIRGRAAHAGMAPEKGVSAIGVAARAIAGMRLGRIDHETTANVGVISGGLAGNIVPERCSVTAECRSHSPEKLEAQCRHMVEAFRAAAAEAGAEAEIEVEVSFEPYAIPEDAPVVRRFQAACGTLGFPVSLNATGGGSDNNILVRHGIAGIVPACGMTDVHSTAETLAVRDFADTARLAERLMILP